jgi:hypothetical protein
MHRLFLKFIIRMKENYLPQKVSYCAKVKNVKIGRRTFLCTAKFEYIVQQQKQINWAQDTD